MSRESILANIRTALGTATIEPPVYAQGNNHARSVEQNSTAMMGLFEHRLEEYGARIFHCSEQKIRDTIAEVLLNGHKETVVVPSGIIPEWLDARIGWLHDNDLSFPQLSDVSGVLTAATAAIAESGSIVLQHGPAEGRRALTLLPDYHVCVVRADQVVATLPECLVRLLPTATRLTTFISGPSATADIEMTRIKGVHGPRSLDVILVQ